MSADALAQVRDFQAATRRIVRNERLGRQRTVLIAGLADKARTAQIPDMCREAIWRESEFYLTGRAPAQPPAPGDVVERALRLMRVHGYQSCPRCRRALPDMATLDRWAANRRAYVKELQIREAAV